MDLSGQVAVVTGAAQGIGFAVAEEFAARGAAVAVLDLDAAGAASAASRLGERARGFAVDVAESGQVDAAFAAVVDHFGGLDIVVNNAGVGIVGPLIVETTDEQWARAIGVMQTGVFYCMRAAARHLLPQRHGVVVNIASVRGLTSNPGRIAYCAAKAAVVMMTKVAAGEWGPHNVRANAICPGWQRTPMSEADFASGVVTEQQLLDAVPLGRLGEPHEIARLAAYLCGPDAGYISGAEITIDGGMITIPSDGTIPR